MSTTSFENSINVVFWIQFYFTTGCVPIARGLRFSRPFPTFDRMLPGYERRATRVRVRALFLDNCFTRRQLVRVECSFQDGSLRHFIGIGF